MRTSFAFHAPALLSHPLLSHLSHPSRDVTTGTQVGTLRGNAGARHGLALVGGPAGIGAAGGGAGGGAQASASVAAAPPPLVISAQAGKAIMHTWLLGKVRGEAEWMGAGRFRALPST